MDESKTTAKELRDQSAAIGVFIFPELRIKPSLLPEDPPFDDVFDETGQGPPVSAEEIREAFEQQVAVTPQFVTDALSFNQGTPEWLKARMNRVGASVFNSWRGVCAEAPRARSMRASMYLNGGEEEVGFACRQGSRNEPLCEAAALALYQKRENAAAGEDEPVIKHIDVDHEGTLVWHRFPMFNASTDGIAWVEYSNGKVDVFNCEWKCPLTRGGYGGYVPESYWYQMQQQMTIYRDSRRLHELAKARGWNLERDLVPGWTWRTMFGVYQDGATIQLQFVQHEEAKYMEEMEKVRHTYMTQYMPRLVRMLRGDVSCPCIDWMPPCDVSIDMELSDDSSDEDAHDAVSSEEDEALGSVKTVDELVKAYGAVVPHLADALVQQQCSDIVTRRNANEAAIHCSSWSVIGESSDEEEI